MLNAESRVAGSETGVDKWNDHATTAVGIEPSVGKGNVQDANLHAFVEPLFRNDVEQSKLNAAGQKLRIVNEAELDAAQLPRIVDDAQLDAANRPFARIDEADLNAVQFSGLIEHARLKTDHATIDDVGEAEMDALYSPLHSNNQAITRFNKKNVVVLIVESFGREYSGYFNNSRTHALTQSRTQYVSYTPFFDSLASHSLTFRYSFANGRKSIDGMPSILSSIPMFVEPFFTTPASLNDISGIAGLLADEGYSSAFFHGAENGSMGFQAFARTTGFQRYYGRDEYDADARFGGDNDFDGTWAIWDEPFLQYYALTMSDMKEPFVTAVFTASSTAHQYATMLGLDSRHIVTSG